jgi:type I restriction enzyme S subunit
MKHYLKYKASDIEWIGDIPESWKVIKLGYLSKMIVPMRDKPLDLSGQIPWLRIEDFDGKYISNSKSGQGVTEETVSKMNLKIFPQGTVVCSCSCAMGKTAIVKAPLITNQTFIGIVPNKTLSSDYLYYLITTSERYLNSISTGAIQTYLSREDFESLKIPSPSLKEQLYIATFLDTKTAEINTAISKKQQLMQLLNEKKEALISEAVTKGINPDVTLQETGIDWLSKIPQHWEVKKLKYIIKDLVSGSSVNSLDQPVSGNEIGILKTSCVYSSSFDPLENKKVLEEEIERVCCPVIKNSIIISRMNTPDLVGASGYVTNDYPNLFLPDRLWQTVFYEKKDISVKWLYFLMISQKFRSELSSKATGTSSSMKNISKDDLLNTQIPYPDFNTQCLIANYIEEVISKTNTTTSKIEKEITLLEEYKASLIYEAVTGKIDVIDHILKN